MDLEFWVKGFYGVTLYRGYIAGCREPYCIFRRLHRVIVFFRRFYRVIISYTGVLLSYMILFLVIYIESYEIGVSTGPRGSTGFTGYIELHRDSAPK